MTVRSFLSPLLILTVSLFSLGLVEKIAQAQTTNEFSQQIRNQLDILTESSQFEQYEPVLTHIDDVGLNAGESKTWDLPVDANTEYVIAAVCDDHCQNVDLELIEGDRIVDFDREEDAYPMIVGVTGEHRYRARVTMEVCSVNPCYSGFRLFRLEP